MKGDDTAVAGVAFHIVEHILGCHPLGIVAGDEIPHDDLILVCHPPIDTRPHPSVGGGGRDENG